MKPPNNLEKKILSDTYWRVQLVRMKVQAHSSLEPPLEYNHDQIPLMNQGKITFVTILVVIEILCSFRLVLERKIGKGIPKPSRLKFLEKILSNNFALSDAKNNTFQYVEWIRYSRFTFVENTISILPKIQRAKFIWSNRLFCFTIGSFKNPYATITGLRNFLKSQN